MYKNKQESGIFLSSTVGRKSHPPFHPPIFCRHSLKLLSPTLPKLMNWILLSPPPLSSDPDNPPKFGTCTNPQGGWGYFHIKRSGGLAPNFASKNINDKYPKFCPLNFRYDPKIGTFSQLLRLVVTELPKFFLLVGELGLPCPKFCLQT